MTTTDRTLVSVRITDHGHLVDTVDTVGLGRAMSLGAYIQDHLDVTIRDRGNDLVVAERLDGTWKYMPYNLD